MNTMKQIFFVLLTIALANNVFAAAKANDNVTVVDPYVRAVPPGQTVSAAFMQLENKGDSISVVNASSPVSKVVELHTHTHEDGMMQMRRVDKIDIPANGKTVLQPGGLHIMLIGLHADLEMDQKVSITLEFSDGSSKVIEAPVRKIMMKGMMNMKH